MINLENYYRKLAGRETISEDEIADLLSELKQLRRVAAHLASCQAATVEGLPKSASKSSVARHISICRTAADALAGDASSIKHPGSVQDAITRCNNAATRGID
jgi:hypothetical protein